jgi:DUF971 family protein
MSATPRATYPIEVQRLTEPRLVRIEWSDGHISEYPFAYLRGWCPCAGCQGHGGERRFIHADNDLDRIGVVGRYALNPVWADGHETGIYSYAYLRELCPCDACASMKT